MTTRSHPLIGVLALTTLAACGASQPTPETIAEACVRFEVDEEAVQQLSDERYSFDTFCSCLEATAVTLDEVGTASTLAAMVAITNALDKNDHSVMTVANDFLSRGATEDATVEDRNLSAGVQLLERLIHETSLQLRENDGICPTTRPSE